MSLPVARVEELEGILRQELQPDEAFRVVWQDGRPKVEALADGQELLLSADPTDLAAEGGWLDLDQVYGSPQADLPDELRGVLLTANQAINDAGMWVVFGALIAVETLCVGIHMSWWSSIGPLAIEQLQGGWVYLLIHLIGLCAFGFLMQIPEQRAYQRTKRLVDEAIDRAGLNRFEVIGRIQQDQSLTCVAGRLKHDTTA